MKDVCVDCALAPVGNLWMCADGKVRCGQHRRELAGDAINQTDAAVADAIAALHVGNERLASRCREQIVSALATVRREEREAAGQIAFAEAIRQGISAERAIAIKSKIEASANPKEGMNG